MSKKTIGIGFLAAATTLMLIYASGQLEHTLRFIVELVAG